MLGRCSQGDTNPPLRLAAGGTREQRLFLFPSLLGPFHLPIFLSPLCLNVLLLVSAAALVNSMAFEVRYE